MLSTSDLLKEGTKHLSGVSEACLQNIDAVRQLANILRTSLGPNGKNLNSKQANYICLLQNILLNVSNKRSNFI
jgi:hypothetical protein